MKRRDFIRRLFQLGLGAYAMSHGGIEAQAATRQLIINYYNQWKPISWSVGNEPTQGILINVLNEILYDRMGLDVVHQGLPWKRAQYDVEMGKADALCVVPSEARRKYLLFADVPSLEIEVVIFYNKHSPLADRIVEAASFEDLHQFHVGEIMANDWAKEKLKNHTNVKFVPKLDSLMKVLSRGRVDMVMAPDLVGLYLANKTNNRHAIDFVRKPFIGKKTKMYFGIRKTYRDVEKIMERFNTEMLAFRESERYEDLISNSLVG